MDNSAPTSARRNNALGDRAAERRCIVTGRIGDKSALLRFVAGPDGRLVADLHGRLGGRGAWVEASYEVLKTAVDKNLFARHLKQKVSIDEGFFPRLSAGLQQRICDRLSLMRKSGQLICGGGSLRESAAVINGLLIADDASRREAGNLTGELKPDWVEDGLPAALLGRVAGRGSVAYAGILNADTKAARQACERLRAEISAFRSVCGGQTGNEKLAGNACPEGVSRCINQAHGQMQIKKAEKERRPAQLTSR